MLQFDIKKVCPCEKVQDVQSFRILVFCIKQKKNVIEFTSWCLLPKSEENLINDVIRCFHYNDNFITLYDLIVKLNVLK